MKLGLDDSVQESSDKVTNFGDCSGDIDGEDVRIVPRTIKHAKRRGVLPASQTNDHMQWKEMPIKKKKRSCKIILSCSIAFVSIILCYPYISSVISNYFPKNISSYMFGEQCNSMWTTRNVTKLRSSLEANVFGQHIATKLILSVLNRRWSQSEIDTSSKKPLVLSFHGWTGSGKNYVSKFIAEALFDRGLRSQFVHLFVSTLHFHDESQAAKYRIQLQDWVRGNVSKCADSLFIIDEIDKMPSGVLDGLKPFMDFHSSIDGIDFRRATFIFLSNTGGREITRRIMKFWQEGRRRESINYFELEGLVSKGAFNEEGGLHHASIIDRSLIDVYVPFLPLEQSHVRQCVDKELEKQNIEKARLPSNFADQVVSELSFWPADTKVFAAAGCKRVVQKVDELLYDILNEN